MKAFFEGMNFVRAVMLMCFVAAGALGYMVYEGRAQVDELKDQVNRQAGLITNEVQLLAVKLEALRKVESGSEFQAIEKPKQYVSNIARSEVVTVGDLNFGNPRDKSFAPGTVDNILPFTPASKTRSYRRAEISNLFYEIERNSPFAKVTKMEFRLLKKVKPQEHPIDSWTFSGEMTIRQPGSAK